MRPPPAGAARRAGFRTWTDGDLDRVHDRRDLLTNLTAYRVTRTIGSSMRLRRFLAAHR